MASVRFLVEPDVPAYIAGGHDPNDHRIMIDLESLTPEQRGSIASRTRRRDSGPEAGALYLVGLSVQYDGQANLMGLLRVTAPTSDAALEAIASGDARAERARAEQVARLRKAAGAACEGAARVLAERRTREVRDHSGAMFRYPDWPDRPTDGDGAARFRAITECPEAQAWIAELDAQREAAAQAAQAARAAQKAESDARYESGVAALRAWGSEHGSERSRLLIEEDHKAWLRVTEDEYLAAHTPPGLGVTLARGERLDMGERTRPHAADILALRRLRALAEASDGVLTGPRLGWAVVYRGATDDDDPDEVDSDHEVADRKFAALGVTIKSPAGGSLDVWGPVRAADAGTAEA